MYMVALYTIWYNFAKMHKSLRMTPAMAAGVADRLWSMEDIAEMVDASLPPPSPRGPYKNKFQTETLPENENIDKLTQLL
jgi:hypothetical protein